MIEEELIYKIRGAIFAVYKELGLGLLVNFNTDDISKSIRRVVC